MLFDYIDGGAGAERTVGSNERAFEEVLFRPRLLRDVSEVTTETTFLGREFRLPVVLAPIGLAGAAGREGEAVAARAASDSGVVSVVSTASSMTLEKVAQSGAGSQWFQLYPWGDRDQIEHLMKRASGSGYETLVVTLDVPVTGKRERDLRNGFTVPPRPTFRNVLDVFRRPRWLGNLAFGPKITFANLTDGDQTKGAGAISLAKRHERLLNPSHTWEDLKWMCDSWDGPILAKGITHPDDAAAALDAGVDGVIVSNHGGRQLDSMISALDALPMVRKAVGAQVPIVLDGGVRSGGDILKAIALGANLVSIGRPWVYALASGKRNGVKLLLKLLQEDLQRDMALCGISRLDEANDGILIKEALIS